MLLNMILEEKRAYSYYEGSHDSTTGDYSGKRYGRLDNTFKILAVLLLSHLQDNQNTKPQPDHMGN